MEFVSPEWLAERLGSRELAVLDPRTRERYLSGHAAGAVHVPIRSAFEDGRLLGDDELAAWLGSRGVSPEQPVAIYDDYDGQKGAMLAWILEYLGHEQVGLLDAPFARWTEAGQELFYRPVTPKPVEFRATPRPELRATRDEVTAAGLALDVRAQDEYDGSAEVPDGEAAGHIPGAVLVEWRSFVTDGERLYRGPQDVRDLVASAGAGEAPVVYCRSGPRAAVAVVALRRAGVPARLYDGSFLDWTRAGLPVEAAGGVRP